MMRSSDNYAKCRTAINRIDMKRIVLSIVFPLIVITANAQSISDYFFNSNWQTNWLINKQMPEEELRYSYQNGYVVIARFYNGKITSSTSLRTKIYKDRISVTEVSSESRYDKRNFATNEILLKLPPSKWTGGQEIADNSYRKVNYKADMCIVKINSEYVDAIKITHDCYNIDGNRKMGYENEYWGKGYGILAIETHYNDGKTTKMYATNFEGEATPKEIADLQAAERERRFTIENVLKLREKAKGNKRLYDDMKKEDANTYSKNYSEIKKCIENTFSAQLKEDCDVRVIDSVYVSYDGEITHKVSVEPAVSDEIIKGLEAELNLLALTPAETQMPNVDTTYTVNSFAKFLINYKAETKVRTMILKRKGNYSVKFVGGDKPYYDSHKKVIDSWFYETKGEYTLKISKRYVNGRQLWYGASIKIEDKKGKDKFEGANGDDIIKPSFMGGDANVFAKWVNERVVYPDVAMENGVQGVVKVAFTINANGQVDDVKVLQGVSQSIDEEAIRVVTMSPKWIPGVYKGERRSYTYTFPITFALR